MKQEESLARCAALMEKLGRGPEWEGEGDAPDRLRFIAGRWHLAKRNDDGWVSGFSASNHEAACLLQVWLEDELVAAHRLPSRWKAKDGDYSVHMNRAPWMWRLISVAEHHLHVEGVI